MLSGVPGRDPDPVPVSPYARRRAPWLLAFADPLTGTRWNHHLLSTVAARPDWLTIPQGSRSYVDAIMKGFPPNHLYLNTPVKSATNDEDGRVRLHLGNGKSEVFDHVVLATHGDEAFSIIRASATAQEEEY